MKEEVEHEMCYCHADKEVIDRTFIKRSVGRNSDVCYQSRSKNEPNDYHKMEKCA